MENIFECRVVRPSNPDIARVKPHWTGPPQVEANTEKAASVFLRGLGKVFQALASLPEPPVEDLKAVIRMAIEARKFLLTSRRELPETSVWLKYPVDSLLTILREGADLSEEEDDLARNFFRAPLKGRQFSLQEVDPDEEEAAPDAGPMAAAEDAAARQAPEEDPLRHRDQPQHRRVDQLGVAPQLDAGRPREAALGEGRESSNEEIRALIALLRELKAELEDKVRPAGVIGARPQPAQARMQAPVWEEPDLPPPTSGRFPSTSYRTRHSFEALVRSLRKDDWLASILADSRCAGDQQSIIDFRRLMQADGRDIAAVLDVLPRAWSVFSAIAVSHSREMESHREDDIHVRATHESRNHGGVPDERRCTSANGHRYLPPEVDYVGGDRVEDPSSLQWPPCSILEERSQRLGGDPSGGCRRAAGPNGRGNTPPGGEHGPGRGMVRRRPMLLAIRQGGSHAIAPSNETTGQGEGKEGPLPAGWQHYGENLADRGVRRSQDGTGNASPQRSGSVRGP